MLTLKKWIGYVLLACYVSTIFAGLSILVGLTKAANPAVIGVFSVIVAQTAAIIVAIIKAPEYFAEPEAIANLQKEHAEAITILQKQVSESQEAHRNFLSYIATKVLPDDPRFHALLKQAVADP